ncbi:MAG: amino acid permease [Candidatus Aminicenantes bacterium]|nr:amino acid permease [Candidatus Aminicenantes bacterium]
MEAELASGPTVDKSKIELPRVLGLWDVVMIVVGGVIGSGIFLVPSEIARALPAPLLLLAVWVVGGLFSFFGALAFAELGAAIPEAGGIYVFLREAYGPLLSFLFGWTLFLVIDSGACATLAVAFSTKYLPHFVPMTSLSAKIVAVLFVTFLGIVNYVGVRWGANLQNLLTVIKTVALVGVCVVIFFFAKGNAHPENFIEPKPSTFNFGLLGAFGVGLVASLWAYKGWESATYSAGETKNPQRNLPLGILLGTVIVIVLYIIANLAYLYVLPVGKIAGSERIASDAMNVVVGPVGASIVAFLILFSILGAANQTILCSPRVYFAMARDGLFFKRIADCHPKFLTPYVSIIAISVWSIILSLTGTFEQLFTYVVFGEWIFFGLTVAAVIVLRRKRPDLPRPYKTWGYPVTPIVFCLAAVYIAVSALIGEFVNAMGGLVIIIMGIPAYMYWRTTLRGVKLAMIGTIVILVDAFVKIFLMKTASALVLALFWVALVVGAVLVIGGLFKAASEKKPK